MPSKAEGVCLIPDWGARTPRASQPKKQNIKQKQYCSQFDKDFKMIHSQKSHRKIWITKETQNSQSNHYSNY